LSHVVVRLAASTWKMNARECKNGIVGVVMMILMLLDTIDAYASGPPVGTCSSMTPNHDDATSQTIAAPYTITTSVTCYTPGQALTGRLIL